MALAGIVLQLIGIGMGLWAFASTWRQHREDRPLLPELQAAGSWFRRVILRREARVVHGTGSAMASAGALVGRVVVETPLPPDAGTEQILELFRRRQAMFDEDIRKLTRKLDKVDRHTADRMAQLEAEWQRGDAELRDKVTHVAVGTFACKCSA